MYLHYIKFLNIIFLTVGCFYWTLGNIHPRNRSLLRVIQLFAQAKCKDLKDFGAKPVLQPFVDDINRLASVSYFKRFYSIQIM